MSELTLILNAISDVKQQLGGVQEAVKHIDGKINNLRVDFMSAQANLQTDVSTFKTDTSRRFQELDKRTHTARGLWLAVKGTVVVLGAVGTFVGVLTGITKLLGQ